MLDIDSEYGAKVFWERLPKVKPLIKRIAIESTRPNHYHIFIKLRRHHRFVNISALQTYLGSDLKRELANMSRIIAGARKPILLIHYSRVKHWRKPDVICSCQRKYQGRKLSNCAHLINYRGHQAKYGYISTRLKLIGIKKPY
jgi:hypothetical protein